MKTREKKKVTIMLDADVYHGLKQKVGDRGIGNFMSQVVRPHVVHASLADSYRELAESEESAIVAKEWESVDEVIEADNVWRL